MAEVALRDYLNEIDGLIEHGSNAPAVQHCQHLLSQYPKCAEAYRLLGKALLEQEEDSAAQDLFERVLSVDPEDFVARVGLSIIHDRNNRLELAIWHMERAFDIAPSNELIQGELRRLYARRDGVSPDRIALTRSALARMYAKGDLYDEAIADLRNMLTEQPERIDLQIQLAEALWRNEQRLEAIDWTQRVTKRLPNCVKANLINGVVLRDNGELTESETLFKSAQAVDPENIYAEELFGPSGPLPLTSVMVSRLELRGTEELLEAAAPVAEVEEVPDWLRGITDLDTLAAPQLEGTEAYPALPTGVHMPEAAPAAEIPDWLQGLAESTAPVAEEEVPDWLAALSVGAAAAAAEQGKEEPEPSAALTPEEEVPDWLAQLQEKPPAAFSTADSMGLEPQEETPDWLAKLQAAEPPIAGETTSDTEVPDWLRALGSSAQTAQPTEASFEAGVPAAGLVAAGTTWWVQAEEEPVEEKQPETPVLPEAAEIEAAAPAELKSITLESAPESMLAVEEAAPTPPEEMPSADDALAFLTRLAAGKEDQLRAEAEAEAEARMTEIMGRKAEAKPMEPKGDKLTGVALAAGAAATGAVMAAARGKAKLEEQAVVETKAESTTLPVEAAPALPEEMPSADDALAFLAKLAAGKEDQLRAEAEAEAEARMAEIMGRKAEAKPVEPKAEPIKMTVPAATVAAVAAGLEGQKEKKSEAGPVKAKAEVITPSVEAAPALPEEMPSADDALAFLAKLAAGKEAQLRAEAEAEAEARMAEIMGRKAEAKPVEPKAEKPTAGAALVAGIAVGATALPHGVAGPEALPTELQAEEALPSSEDTDWLNLLQPTDESAVVEVTPEGELPEWLRAMRPPADLSSESEGEAISATAESNLPDWLQAMRPAEDLLTESELLEEEAAAPEATPTSELPDWLREMQPPETAFEERPVAAEMPTDLAALLEEEVFVEPVGELPSEAPEEAAIAFGLVAEIEPAVAGGQPRSDWWVQVADDEGEEAYQLVAERLPGALSSDWWVQSAEDEGEEPLRELPEFQQVALAGGPTMATVSADKKQTHPLRPQTGPLAKTGPLPRTPTGPLGAAETASSVESLLSRLDANKEDHEARLELARVYWATGKRDDAFVAYTRLAASGPYAKEIMPDLESITEIQDHPDWHRLMGDVYMKAGKLTYALDHYRRALSEL